MIFDGFGEKSQVSMKEGVFYFYFDDSGKMFFNVQREYVPSVVRLFADTMKVIITNEGFQVVRFRYDDYEVSIYYRNYGVYKYKVVYKKIH